MGEAGRRRKATQADVARLAGVSPSVVSTVLNGSAARGNVRVGDETRRRVVAAMTELGYVPNVAARRLATGSNHIIGVFSYEPTFPVKSLDFYQQFLVGIEEEAEQRGYNLLLFSATKNAEGSRSIYANGSNALNLADGAILLGPHEDTAELARLANEDYPFVLVGRREVRDIPLTWVGADYLGGTATVVERLVRLGHRRIAYVRSVRDHESLADRQRGFQQGCHGAGLAAAATPIVTTPQDDDTGDIALDLMVTGTTAIVAESPVIAHSLWREAVRRGHSVPEDLSLVGLGGATPPEGGGRLASLETPRIQMGRAAVSLLLEMLADPSRRPESTVLACTFDAGESVGPPSRH